MPPTNDKRFSRPTSPSLCFAGQKITPLQALVCIVLADCRHKYPIDAGRCVTTWRRWLASNLSLLEYQRKAWRRDRLCFWWAATLKELRGLKLVPISGLLISDAGASLAAGLRPLFNAPIDAASLFNLNSHIHANKTGRFAS